MIALGDVRAALYSALEEAGYNVAEGGDIVPMAALVSTFDVTYHANIAGGTSSGMHVASCRVAVVTDRGDEASAVDRVDDVMTGLWLVIEKANGPWRSVLVRSASLAQPVTVGEQTYVSVAFFVEFYV